MGALGPEAGWNLRVFGAHVHQAFGHTAYHVGSSLTSKDKFRDVDVRLILPDDEYAAFFGANPFAKRQRMWDLAWSALGQRMTYLPVDFQFQQQTFANEKFDGPRSALIVLSSELRTVRDDRPTEGDK